MRDVDLKRQQLRDAYPTKSWKERVRLMSDQQVIAVWLRFQKSENFSLADKIKRRIK